MERKKVVTFAPDTFSSDQTRKLEPQGPVHKPLDSDADNDVVASDSPGDELPSLDDEKSGGSGTAKPFTGKSNFEKPVVYSSTDLRVFSNDFNADNLIGLTQFGRLYRGKIEKGKEARFVTVKTWDERSDPFLEEVMLLTHPSMKGHPNLVKLIGGCRDKQMKAAVYDLNPLHTLHNYMTRGYERYVFSSVAPTRQFSRKCQCPTDLTNVGIFLTCSGGFACRCGFLKLKCKKKKKQVDTNEMVEETRERSRTREYKKQRESLRLLAFVRFGFKCGFLVKAPSCWASV
ncbi:Serine-threonine/tyrosine-protein kinase [Theobroma cacao]|nr:Serine-threonine/tyrosine-protein kinase [Theobroma cacao]